LIILPTGGVYRVPSNPVTNPPTIEVIQERAGRKTRILVVHYILTKPEGVSSMRNFYPPACSVSIFALLILLLTGCSGGSDVAPTTPGVNPDDLALQNQVRDSGTSGGALVGYYDVSWEPGSLNVSVRTGRAANQGMDVTGFLDGTNSAVPVVSFSVTGLDRFESDGLVEMEVAITNPYETEGPDICDVRGMLISDGSKNGIFDPSINYPGGRDILLINADGYHGLSDGNDTGIHGYKYFASGMEPSAKIKDFLTNPDGGEQRGIFQPGDTVIRKYILRIPDGKREFNFAVHAQVGAGNRMPQTFVIDSDLSESTVYYIDENNRGGKIVADLYFWDWQASDGNAGLLNQLSKVVIEAPSGMIPGGFIEFSGTMLENSLMTCCGGDHMARFRFEIPGVTPSAGIEQLLVTVISKQEENNRTELRSYSRTALILLNEIPPEGEKVNLLVIIEGADVGLYEDAKRLGDQNFDEIDFISDRIKEIYRTNRQVGITVGLHSQIQPLVDRMLELRADRATFVRNYLEDALNPVQDLMTSRIESIPGTSVTSSDVVLNSLAVQTSRNRIVEIENLDGVVEVIEDSFTVEPMINISAQSLKLRPGTYADVVWNEGYHGEGVDVMAMDTGVYTSHSALSGISFFSEKFPTYAGGCTTGDDQNHGTMTCGVIASRNATNRGMAYGLESYYNAKLCNGSFPLNDTIFAAYNWAGIGGTGYNDAEVVNFSMAFSFDCTNTSGNEVISAFVDQTIDLYGVIWCISAGNRGVGCTTDSIRDKPATCYNGFSVAGVRTNNTGVRGDDYYYTTSKYGPVTAINGIESRLKPEISGYTAVQAPGYDGGWYWFGGTSAAAPHITGLSTVLLGAGVADSLEMRALVMATAEDYTGSPATAGPDNYAGFGIPDAWEAYSHIGDIYSGTVSPSSPTDYYQIENVQSGDRVVVVYDKHGAYPSWAVSNIDLKAYDNDTQALLYETTKTYENKEYIEFGSGDVGRDVIIHVHLTQIGSGLSGEDYSIAANATMTEVVTDGLVVEITKPVTNLAEQYNTLEIETTISNGSPTPTTLVEATLDLPPGWYLMSGANPQDLGTIDPYTEKFATWEVFIEDAGWESVSVNATGYNFGNLQDSDAKSVNAAVLLILSGPAEVTENDIFAIEADYENKSGGLYSGMIFTIDFPTGYVSLNSGDNPSVLGDVADGDTAHSQWDFEALNPGDIDFTLDVEFTCLGNPISFTTDPFTVTINEYVDPSIDPNDPILIAPHDGTIYELGDMLYFRWTKGTGPTPSAYYLNAWVNGAHSTLVPSGGVFLGTTTILILDQRFVEIYARDGEWEWAIGAMIGGTKYWSERWTITKQAAPIPISPLSGSVVSVNQFYNWTDTPGAVNYIARVTGLLPGGVPYYQPLNSSSSQFILTEEFYVLLSSDVQYTWAVSGTYFLGSNITADDQATLSRLSYSPVRSFWVE